MVSVIIATSERVETLGRLLERLCRVQGAETIDHEIIVANNARDEAVARAVRDLVEEYSRRHRGRYWEVREPMPGKCRAQNRAIASAKGSILAFLDDDVNVTPPWLGAVRDFFTRTSFDAMQGPILMPPEVRNDGEFLRLYHRYRTIPFVQYGPGVIEITTLTGANMAIRKEVFSRAGLFNEELGPGRSGISEDVEFAQRMLRCGGRIGYEPRAAVYHEADWGRFTEEFFRLRHEQQGRSRLIYKQSSLFSIVPNLLRSVWTFGWHSLVGPERRKYRAKGRYFHYRAMLLERLRRSGVGDSSS